MYYHFIYIKYNILHDNLYCTNLNPLTITELLTHKDTHTHTKAHTHEKTKSNRGWPSSPLEPNKEAYQLTHGSACIIRWQAGLPDILISPYIAQFMGGVTDMIHYGLKVEFCFRYLLPPIIILMQDCSQALNSCKCLQSLSCECVLKMLLVLSITFYSHYNIGGFMWSTGPFQFMWLKRYIFSSCYYHHQIGSIDLTHCYHMFPWLCAWDVFASYSVTYILGKPRFCFHYYCAIYDECK